MTIDKIPAYRTPDGKVFYDEAAAVAHVHSAQFSQVADEYIAARKLIKATATRAKNIIADYLAFEHIRTQG